ncbi:SRPBCC family protein [Flavobacterium sp.]|uniref:SRPBCC family protein n=1 Tax=Flavobacterium sp. TaxID=239 RepID=UPI00262FB781|nr:SRPBCC family protein [Flavobacterium sp.]
MNLPANIKIPEVKKNISDFERAVSALGGLYLLYDSLKRNRSIPELAAAGFMLFRGVSGYCPATQAAENFLDKKRDKKHNSNVNIHARLIVKKPVEEVYNFWRNLGNLPLFMEHLESVTVLNESLSEWKAKLPGGIGTVGWKAQIVGEEPNRYVGWSSLPGSAVRNAGKVEFKDAGELGTLIHIVFSYHAPLGSAGEEVAKLMNPVFENMVRKDVMGFKRFMETGTPDKISQETVKIYSY